MKLHLVMRTYPHWDKVLAWCGRTVPRSRIARPQDVSKSVECKACRKAFLNSPAYYDADTSVSLTR